MIRIVGLSATLPNYRDVAAFLGVNPDAGLFYFDASYRPVPLEMQFVGVSEKNALAARNIQDDVCYDKVRVAHPCRLKFWQDFLKCFCWVLHVQMEKHRPLRARKARGPPYSCTLVLLYSKPLSQVML